MVTDSPSNTSEIKYYYVKSFKWNTSVDAEMLGGNPKKGKIYRGWQNKDTDAHRLIFKPKNVIVIETLVTEGLEKAYSSEIVEIVITNILDLPLKETDLDMMLSWIESDNKDILISSTPSLDIPAMISNALSKKSDLEMLLDTLHEEIEELADMDAMMLFQVAKIVSFILDEIHTERSGPFDYDWMNMDKVHGLGANMNSAFQNMYQYVGANSKKNEETIISAVHNLLVEMKRREHNNLNS